MDNMDEFGITYTLHGPIVFTKDQYEDFYKDRFILTEEYNKIVDIVSKSDDCIILVNGTAGSGKTTLLMMLNHALVKNTPLNIIKGFDISEDYPSILERCGFCAFIDDLDQVDQPSILLSYLSSHGVKKIICTSRSIMTADALFSHIFHLAPLTINQISELVEKMGSNSRYLHSKRSQVHFSPGNHDLNTPRDVLRSLLVNQSNSDLKKFFSEYRNFIYRFGGSIDYGTNTILRSNDIYLPSSDIIKNVSIITDSLLKQARDNPQIIHSFTPREFEKMVRELLDKQGYEVQLTKQTRDGGKDLIVVQKSLLGQFSIYVECKKYDTHRPISVGLIRELYGTITADAVTAGMMITTSYFTKDAKEFTERIKHRMSLVDFNDLASALAAIDM